MTLKRFAEEHRLKVSRDECGDATIILGKKGHLYVDGGKVCAMWTNAPPMLKSRLESLGWKIWQGDISNSKGRRVQDAWVKGIRPEAYKLAIQLVGTKQRRVMSPAQRAALEKATVALKTRTGAINSPRPFTVDRVLPKNHSVTSQNGLPTV